MTVTGVVNPGPQSNKWYITWAATKQLTGRVGTNTGVFSISDVPIVEGTNTLVVTVTDVSGNKATQTVTFTKSSLIKTETTEYDLNGNLTNWVRGGTTNAYSYSRENQLTNVASNGFTTLECWYDGIGRRMAKREVVDGVTNESLYVYDGWDVLAVLNGQGDLREVYTRGLGLAGDIGTIVAETKFANAAATNTYYYHGNHRGNITTVRSTNGTTVATFDYRSFGELRSSTGETVLRYRFSSKEYDESSGLYYFGYRQYSPSLGRWLSPDPLGLAGGLNLYEYCGSGPVNNVDPLGLRWFGGGDDGWSLGRPNSIIPPGGTLGTALETYGPAMETMSKIHDPLVGALVPDLGGSGKDTIAEKIIDGIVNVPSMPVTYAAALLTETIKTPFRIIAALIPDKKSEPDKKLNSCK